MYDSIQNAISQETTEIKNVEAIPSEYLKPIINGGRIEKISYITKDYFGDEHTIEKYANVYLPADYDSKKQYCVLYLLHGIGGSENEWGMVNNDSFVKMMMDNFIEKGEINSFIIVTPNGRSSVNFADINSDYNSFYKFGLELRNELIPYMDSHYSTFADRNHRAIAGLSMGGMQTINIGICECLDLFSYFGAFSAAPTSYQSQRIASYLENNSQFKVNYFYNICGIEDTVAYASSSNAAKNLSEICSEITERNFTWQEVHGGHDFQIWYLGFYNFAKIIFKQN